MAITFNEVKIFYNANLSKLSECEDKFAAILEKARKNKTAPIYSVHSRKKEIGSIFATTP